MRQAGWHDLQQSPRDGFGRLMGKPGKDNLIEFIRLLANGLHDLRVPVAVRDDPPRGNTVEDTTPVGCFEPRTFGTRDRQHLGFQSMLGERMPDGGAIHGPNLRHLEDPERRNWRQKLGQCGAVEWRQSRQASELRTRPNDAIVRSLSVFSSPMKAMPRIGMARCFSASIDSKEWLMVPSRVDAQRMTGSFQVASKSICKKCRVSGTFKPPASSTTSGAG